MQDKLPIGTRMRKKSGSSWQGKICGYYSTALTPNGYCIESEREVGSVQIYPASALERAAEVADSISDAAAEAWKQGYDAHDQGREIGADQVASAIRALKP